MSKKVSPIPRGYRTATTCLTVVDIDASVAFYQAAFGAELLTRLAAADQVNALHATVKIGNSIIALNRQAPEHGLFAPVTLAALSSQVHLYVDDVDASWERAVEAGAIIHCPLADAYWGDRSGLLLDGNGHLWSIASKIENLSQDEIARRAQAPLEADYEGEIPGEILPATEQLAEATVAA